MGNQASAPFDLQRLSAAFFSASDDGRLREVICAVSRDAHLHRTQLPPGPGEDGLFTIDPSSPVAAPLIRVALGLDTGLRAAHDRVVPSLVTDAVFWTAYFLRVSEALTSVPAPSVPPVVATAAAPRAAPPSDPVAAATSSPSAPGPRASPLPSAASSSSDPPPDLDETLLLTLPEAFVYRLPPRPSARGHIAASWGLDAPLVTGYLRVVAATPTTATAAPASGGGGGGDSAPPQPAATAGEVSVALWARPDALGGASGTSAPPPPSSSSSLSTAPLLSGHRLIAVCRIPLAEALPPPGAGGGDDAVAREHVHAAVARFLEPAADSSRYFVMRAASGGFLGFGFRDRQAAFDLRAALTDHCMRVLRQREEPGAAGGGAAAGGVEAAAGSASGEGGGGGAGGGASPAAARPSEFALPAGATIHVPVASLLLRKGGRAAEVAAAAANAPSSSPTQSGAQGPRLLAPPRSHAPPLVSAPAAAAATAATATAAGATAAAAAAAAASRPIAETPGKTAEAPLGGGGDDEFGDFAAAPSS